MAHNYLLKKANIDKWIRSYISSTFKRRKFFYHIEEKHLNKSSDYLKDRCKKKKEVHLLLLDTKMMLFR